MGQKMKKKTPEDRWNKLVQLELNCKFKLNRKKLYSQTSLLQQPMDGTCEEITRKTARTINVTTNLFHLDTFDRKHGNQ